MMTATNDDSPKFIQVNLTNDIQNEEQGMIQQLKRRDHALCDPVFPTIYYYLSSLIFSCLVLSYFGWWDVGRSKPLYKKDTVRKILIILSYLEMIFYLVSCFIIPPRPFVVKASALLFPTDFAKDVSNPCQINRRKQDEDTATTAVRKHSYHDFRGFAMIFLQLAMSLFLGFVFPCLVVLNLEWWFPGIDPSIETLDRTSKDRTIVLVFAWLSLLIVVSSGLSRAWSKRKKVRK